MNGYPLAIKQRYRNYPKGVLFENGIALNETAFSIFNLCDGKSTIPEIIRNMAQNYTCSEKEVEIHMESTLNLLEQADLITWTEKT